MSRTWDYTDVFVAACGCEFSFHYEGYWHEKECELCQKILRGEPIEEDECDG